jgi:hypothetical protein
MSQPCFAEHTSQPQQSFCSFKNTDTSARPDALCLTPCSISTVQLGKRRPTCSADCRASSMLFTTMRDLEARGFEVGGAMRDNREMKTVVFPEPVGRETPIREAPLASASVQASKHCS